jgi:hypothetical protein
VATDGLPAVDYFLILINVKSSKSIAFAWILIKIRLITIFADVSYLAETRVTDEVPC